VALDFVHMNHLTSEKLRQYKLVMFPYPIMVPEQSSQPLQEYVRDGGTLVTEARLAWNNERGYASDRIPGLGLWEVVGCRETAVQTGSEGRTELRWMTDEIPGLKSGERLRGRWYEETLEPTGPHARVVAQFANGGAAAVQSQYGKGKTLMLGSYVSAAYQTAPSPEAERFFAGLLAWAGVTPQVTVSGGALEARVLESGNDFVLFLFNHGAARATSSVSLLVPPGTYTATDVVSGNNVPLTREQQVVRTEIALEPRHVQVVHVARSDPR
jgi:beta-galactosidase